LADIVLWLHEKGKMGKSRRRIIEGLGRIGGTPREAVFELTDDPQKGYVSLSEPSDGEPAQERKLRKTTGKYPLEFRLETIEAILKDGGPVMAVSAIMKAWPPDFDGRPSRRTFYSDMEAGVHLWERISVNGKVKYRLKTSADSCGSTSIAPEDDSRAHVGRAMHRKEPVSEEVLHTSEIGVSGPGGPIRESVADYLEA